MWPIFDIFLTYPESSVYNKEGVVHSGEISSGGEIKRIYSERIGCVGMLNLASTNWGGRQGVIVEYSPPSLIFLESFGVCSFNLGLMYKSDVFLGEGG